MLFWLYLLGAYVLAVVAYAVISDLIGVDRRDRSRVLSVLWDGCGILSCVVAYVAAMWLLFG